MKEMTLPADVKEGKTIMPAEWCMCQLMKQRSSFISLLPLLMQIVEIALTMPISSAWPERGTSQVKLIKTRLRSRISNDMLACLLNIAVNGPEVNSHECDTLKMTTEKWLSRRRYKLSTGKSAAREALRTSEKEPTVIKTTNVSTQTETTEDDRREEQEQQEEQALIKLGLAHYADDPGCDDSDADSAMESDFNDSD